MNNEAIILDLHKALENIEADIRTEYMKGRRASGRFGNELRTEIKEKGQIIEGKILGSDYSYFLFHGRKAGRFPNINSIRNWIREKGIISDDLTEEQLVFVISRSISKKGTLEKGYKMKSALEKSMQKNLKDLQKTIFSSMNMEIKKELFESSKYEKQIKVI
jgi:hypothetical protein